MSEELRLTRRGLLQIVTAIVATARFAVRPLNADADDILDAELTEDEPAESTLARRLTKFEVFLKSHGIKPAHLARASGYSRQHLLRVRMGRIEPTRRCIAEIVAACRRLSRERVRASELFDLGDGDGRVIARIERRLLKGKGKDTTVTNRVQNQFERFKRGCDLRREGASA